MALHLVTGGARSGKSTFAEKLTLSLAQRPALYIATAEALDDEMKARIAVHRLRRSNSDWRTIEATRSMGLVLASTPRATALIDCLTLLASNAYLECEDHEQGFQAVMNEVTELIEATRSRAGDVVVVTNEIGMGLVPNTALGRRFRDTLGIANQVVGRAAASVTFLISGIPMRISPAHGVSALPE